MSWNNVTSNSSSAILDCCLPLPPGVVIWPPPLSSYFKTCLFSLPPYEIHYTIVVSLRPLSHPLTLPPSYHNTHFIHSFWNLLFLSFPIRSTMPDYCFPPPPGGHLTLPFPSGRGWVDSGTDRITGWTFMFLPLGLIGGRRRSSITETRSFSSSRGHDLFCLTVK